MRILIISAQEDFKFPLAEACRKQIFAAATGYRAEGKQVEILIVSPGKSESTVEGGIPITLLGKSGLIWKVSYLRGFDSIHFWGTTGLVALLVGVLGRSMPKVFTATDGGVFSVGSRRGMRMVLAGLMPFFYARFNVFTRYQQKLLLSRSRRFGNRIEVIRPNVTSQARTAREKAAHPTLLYMGHLSRFKGVDIVVRLFEELLPNYPDLQLIIADNGLVYDSDCRLEVQQLRDRFSQNVTIKGKIDPYEELSRAHLLIHPVRQHSGTFAFPLSLYECLECRTPFLSTRVEGFREFFDDYFLCEKDDVADFVTRAKKIIDSPEQAEKHVANNFKRLSRPDSVAWSERVL